MVFNSVMQRKWHNNRAILSLIKAIVYQHIIMTYLAQHII